MYKSKIVFEIDLLKWDIPIRGRIRH